MESSPLVSASFLTQANALLRKNLTFQKRNWKTNIGIIAFPVLICLLIVVIQHIVNNELDDPDMHCGCSCVDKNGDGKCEEVCGLEYSTGEQALSCPIPSPPRWLPLLQLPRPEFRALISASGQSKNLPDKSCRRTRSCPASVLFTGNNQTFAELLARDLFTSSTSLNSSDYSNSSDYVNALPNFILGTYTDPGTQQFTEPAFSSDSPLYVLQPQCVSNITLSIPIQIAGSTIYQDVKCIQALTLWRNSSSVVNDELFKANRSNEVTTAYDFLNSNEKRFMVDIWYHSSYGSDMGSGGPELVRVPRLVNVVSNAYLQFLRGTGTKMQFEYVKEMPKSETQIRFDISSLIGELFFVWIVQLLFPVVLTYLVYEKQQNLRIMMQMHGLGNGPYWMISYAYFLFISSLYMLCFVTFGSVIGLKFFLLNDYSIQFVFYFIYINLQIALAFLLATYFSNVKTARVIGYIYVFGSGLLGSFLFKYFVEDASFPRGWILVMELFPAFSLYRGIFEFSQYSFTGNYMGIPGMQWRNLLDSENGMKEVLILMTTEWLIFLLAAYYLDQMVSFGNGIRKDALFFLPCFHKKSSLTSQKPSSDQQASKVFVQIEKPDVAREREVVEQLVEEPSHRHAIICDNLKKVYPGRDGNPEKFAVRGFSLALPRGECFGMLGPNGAGKTSLINMLIGLTTPTSGTAYVQGMDIRRNMDKVYTGMGVCPQHDLLWETLTGREHLLFYGRLKNLKGSALTQAVEESLKSVNLFHGGIADKYAGKYSGGMKRRLSVAISLIGDPKVVYMDEPSTGLDPASRTSLWNVVKKAKQDRAIILTTHSMEEAEVLCDRLGIFVDGSLQCIGNPRELKARYGGTYVLTITSSSSEEKEVEHFVHQLSPNAVKIYHISGTQKFEMPKQEVRIANVFQAMGDAKTKFTIHAWGLADTTLEDVFIKVAKGAEAFNTLS